MIKYTNCFGKALAVVNDSCKIVWTCMAREVLKEAIKKTLTKTASKNSLESPENLAERQHAAAQVRRAIEDGYLVLTQEKLPSEYFVG